MLAAGASRRIWKRDNVGMDAVCRWIQVQVRVAEREYAAETGIKKNFFRCRVTKRRAAVSIVTSLLARQAGHVRDRVRNRFSTIAQLGARHFAVLVAFLVTLPVSIATVSPRAERFSNRYQIRERKPLIKITRQSLLHFGTLSITLAVDRCQHATWHDGVLAPNSAKIAFQQSAAADDSHRMAIATVPRVASCLTCLCSGDTRFEESS